MTEARYGQCDGWTLSHLASGHHYPSIGEFALQRAARELARDLVDAQARVKWLEEKLKTAETGADALREKLKSATEK